jgi:predicted TIM-barrel fold metal-dependent hydrolase
MTAGLVDVHSHFVTPEYVAAAQRAGHQRPDGMPSWPEWNVREHLDLMDRNGIGRAVLSVSSPGVHFGDNRQARALARTMNDTAAGFVTDHPDRFGLFASLPLPDVTGAIAELDHAFDVLHADGVVLASNTAGWYLGDPRLTELWQRCDERAAVVFVHPTSPPNWPAVAMDRPRAMIEFPFDTARTIVDLVLAGVLVRYPRIRFVVTDAGGVLPLLADRVDLFRQDGLPDTATQLAGLWYDIAGTPVPRQWPALAALAGTGHLLYGSGYCFTRPAEVTKRLAAVDKAVGGTWRADLTANTARLLPAAGRSGRRRTGRRALR